MKLINIGFGSLVSAERLVAVVSPDSAPIKRMVQEARERGALVDASYGRRTRAVLLMDNDHLVLSALQPETIAGRIEEDERIFGCVEIGLGTQGEGLGGKSWVAANHTDGIILNPSIYCDGKAIEENGFYVDPECVRICGELGVAGY